MLFNSATFLIFFAVVLALHHAPLPWRWKKFNLLWASYLFYAAWNPPFVLLLWFSTIVDWWIAKRLGNAQSPRARKLLVLGSLCANLGLLAYFKYGGFLLENLKAVLAALGHPIEFAAPDIILPVGISFYTFQTLSYTLDVYRGTLKPWHSFLDYALYVTFFPQLVAGPIVRASDFLPQCIEPRRATRDQFGWGLSLLVLGLFEKVFVADGFLAPIADSLYNATAAPTVRAAWAGTLAFAGQIFCDFAGYSTCAIGVAMCLGFTIPDNFRFPYAAIGFSDFWRRWHISLSSWLRDYLYIPLGGNRRGRMRTYINLMLTMLIGGLWHGASWTFVVWGGLHGSYLVIERFLKKRVTLPRLVHSTPGRLFLAALTFAAVCVTWVFFRAQTFERAFTISAAMLGHTAPGADYCGIALVEVGWVVLFVGAMLAVHWVLRDSTVEHAAARLPWWLRGLILGVMMFLILTVPGQDRAFIYFQF